MTMGAVAGTKAEVVGAATVGAVEAGVVEAGAAEVGVAAETAADARPCPKVEQL
jgi:hypothetical protein